MKKTITKIAVVLVVLVAVLACVVACTTKTPTIESVAIKSSDLPKVNYLVGQPLDLEKGTIIVSDGTEKKEVSLNDAGVTVTGYDPLTAGVQLLTVSYGGKETTYSVTVMEKMFLDNGVDVYFLGESLDRSKGRLVIMDDNAVDSQEVAFNSEEVSVTGFSSSTVGTKTLNVSYNGISGNVKVEVCAVDSFEFKSPTKIQYKSYDESLNTKGGYFILKTASGLVKNVVLTEDMCEGFDNTAVTAENREVSQEITARYGSCSKTFNIGLKYSFLNDIKENLDTVKAMNLDKMFLEGAEYDEEDWELSIETLKMYYELDSAEKKMIETEDAEQLARVAAVAVENEWYNVYTRYPDLFESYNGQIYYNCSDYAKTKAALEGFVADVESAEMEALMKKILADFGKVDLLPEFTAQYGQSITLKDYFGDQSIVTGGRADFAELVGYSLSVYEGLKDFPATWTNATFANAQESAKVKGALEVIANSNYKTVDDRTPYNLVLNWREDYFEVIYAYLYENRETEQANIALMSNVYLPEKLEELFQAVLNSLDVFEQLSQALQQIQYSPSAIDGTDFMYYYYYVQELLAELEGDEVDEQTKYFYETVAFEGFSQYGPVGFDAIVGTPDYYFTMLFSPMLDDVDTIEFWNDYMELVNDYVSINDDATFFAVNGAKVKSLFDRFADMATARQSAFLQLTNLSYAYYGYYQGFPNSAFDLSVMETAGTSYFAYFVMNYFYTVITPEQLNDDVDELFYIYTMALEYYAMGEIGAAHSLVESVENILANGYSDNDGNIVTLTAAEKNAYNTHVKPYMDKLSAKLGHYDYTLVESAQGTYYEHAYKGEVLSTEWQEKIDSLVAEFTRIIAVSAAVEANNDVATSALLVYYQVLESDFLALLAEVEEAPVAVQNAFYHKEFVKIGNYNYTLANALVYYRSSYISLVTGSLDWYEFQNAIIPELSNAMYKVMCQYTDGLANNEVPELTDVIAAMELFAANLSSDAAYYMHAIELDNNGGANGYYSLGIRAALEKALSEEAYTAVEKLLALEDMLILYPIYMDYYGAYEEVVAEINNMLQEAWEEYEVAYAEITDAEAKAQYDELLGGIAQRYVDAAEEIMLQD